MSPRIKFTRKELESLNQLAWQVCLDRTHKTKDFFALTMDDILDYAADVAEEAQVFMEYDADNMGVTVMKESSLPSMFEWAIVECMLFLQGHVENHMCIGNSFLTALHVGLKFTLCGGYFRDGKNYDPFPEFAKMVEKYGCSRNQLPWTGKRYFEDLVDLSSAQRARIQMETGLTSALAANDTEVH